MIPERPDDREGDDFELELLSEPREAFTGFSTLAAMLPPSARATATPWREQPRR